MHNPRSWLREHRFLHGLAVTLLLGFTVVDSVCAQTGFAFDAFGQEVVPSVVTEATASCVGVLSNDYTTFSLSCDHDVGSATAAHLHLGFRGETGPVLSDLGPAASPLHAVLPLSEVEAVQLQAGGLYLDIHTAAHPEGEVRGQVVPLQPLTASRNGFALEAGQVVPPATTNAAGACVAEVELRDEEPAIADLDLRCGYDVIDPQFVRIYRGAPGEEGTAIFEIAPDFFGQIGAVTEAFDLPVEAADLFAGEIFVLVGSASHPQGELRGQVPICFAGPTTLCLNDGRFLVRLGWQSPFGDGLGHAIRETDDSGTFWFFRPSNLELLVKVLDGCGVNGHYWVFFSATTDVAFALTVTDTRTGESRTYENELGMDAEPKLDTAAFAACP